MMAPFWREHRLIVLSMIAWSWAADGALAQTVDQRAAPTSSFAAAKALVAPGEVVYVTDTAGTTIKGKLFELTDDAVGVKIKGDVRSVAAAEVRRIQWQQPDSPFTGVLIGAAVGAIPGIYWLVADPNECSGMCPEDYAAMSIGAVIGGVIDHVLRKRVTVYTAGPSSDRPKSVTIGPFVGRDRNGVQVVMKF
jgi:hypothetical protein